MTSPAPSDVTVQRVEATNVHTLQRLAVLCERTFVRDRYPDRIPDVVCDARHRLYTANPSGPDSTAIAGAAVMSLSGDGHDAYLDLLAVDPAHQGHGIATALLNRFEHTARDLGATTVRIGGHPPHYLWPGVDVAYLPAVCLFDKAGYTRGPTILNLRIDLTDEAVLRAPAYQLDGIESRTVTPRDEGWLVGELRRTWKATWAEEALTALRRAGRGDPAGVHVASAGEKCVGFCVWGANRPHEIGPIGTRPDFRGRGIGTTLLRGCLRDQVAAGLTSGEVQWAGPLAWFSRQFNATFSRAFFTFTKELR